MGVVLSFVVLTYLSKDDKDVKVKGIEKLAASCIFYSGKEVRMATQKEIDVANAIKNLRESRGWSQSELARRVEMDPAQLSRIEHGAANLRVQTLVRFADAFGVDVPVLLGRNAEEFNILWERFQFLSPEKKHRILQHLNDLARLEALDREEPS